MSRTLHVTAESSSPIDLPTTVLDHLITSRTVDGATPDMAVVLLPAFLVSRKEASSFSCTHTAGARPSEHSARDTGLNDNEARRAKAIRPALHGRPRPRWPRLHSTTGLARPPHLFRAFGDARDVLSEALVCSFAHACAASLPVKERHEPPYHWQRV